MAEQARPRQGGTLVIGLVGAPGSGKSLAAAQFASLGCGVIDADRLAREALDEPAVRAQVRRWWGDGVMAPDGSVDRRALGAVVFDDAAERRRLESLVHPRVAAKRAEARAELARRGVRAIIEDCPLLLEAGLERQCDAVVMIDAPRAVREARVTAGRGWSPRELDRREKSQLPLDIKRRRADYVVSNDRSPGELLERVRRVLSQVEHDPPQHSADDRGGQPAGC